MKAAASATARGSTAAVAAPSRWPLIALVICLVYATAEIYGPALRGPFVYDDITLPFLRPELAARPFWGWMVNVRPLLMLSYWINYQLGGVDPLGYHLLNLCFHLSGTAFLYLALRKLLRDRSVEQRAATLLAAFCAGVFLFHPVQTEAVAYVASRSETLSVMFFFAGFAVYLYGRRPEGISWPVSAAVVILAGCAITTKEHTAVLPVLLLFTERFWYASSWREAVSRQWRLWLPFLVLTALAAVFIGYVLANSTSAGFGVAGVRWYDYFFTQCRAIFLYLRLFVLPVDQNFDPDFPLSRTLFDHGAWLGLLALAAGLFAAWRYRRDYPLASYGFFVTLLLLAPTSSVIPIKDVVAERRLYLPMVGLLLIALEWLVRWRKERTLLAIASVAILFAFASATYQRNQLWGNPIRLWEDTIAKSPQKLRLYEHLGHAYVTARRCQDAVDLFTRLTRTTPVLPPELLVHWAIAYECQRQPNVALEKLREAASRAPDPAVYHNIGRLEYSLGHTELARTALEQAVSLRAPWDATYALLGDILKQEGQILPAAARYRRALELNPANEHARQQLLTLTARLGS